jgi:hypothetical protein
MHFSQSPILAMPARPEGRLSFRQFLRLVRENTVATYPPEAFDEDIIAGRLLWRRRFIINEPSAIRHVFCSITLKIIESRSLPGGSLSLGSAAVF